MSIENQILILSIKAELRSLLGQLLWFEVDLIKNAIF